MSFTMWLTLASVTLANVMQQRLEMCLPIRAYLFLLLGTFPPLCEKVQMASWRTQEYVVWGLCCSRHPIQPSWSPNSYESSHHNVEQELIVPSWDNLHITYIDNLQDYISCQLTELGVDRHYFEPLNVRWYWYTQTTSDTPFKHYSAYIP